MRIPEHAPPNQFSVNSNLIYAVYKPSLCGSALANTKAVNQAVSLLLNKAQSMSD